MYAFIDTVLCKDYMVGLTDLYAVGVSYFELYYIKLCAKSIQKNVVNIELEKR